MMPDREKVIKEYEDYVNSYIPVTTYGDYVLEMHKAVLALLKEQDTVYHAIEKAYSMLKIAEDKIKELLKEQEAVEPKHNPLSPTDWFCGKCGMCISRFHDYCPSCGQAVKWE